MLRIVFRVNNCQIFQEQLVCIAHALEELIVMIDIVYTREDLFKIAKSKLFFLKIYYDGKLFIR